MSKWDKKYARAPEGLFGQAPNEYLREIVARSDFGARSVICLADGDGRNSRWLAKQGLTATAVDQSAVACVNGEALDREVGVKVKRIVADLETWQPPTGSSWNAAFVMYLQAPSGVRMAALRTGWQALTRGGWLVVEAFSKSQAQGGTGPGDPDLLYDLGELTGVFGDAIIVEALTGRIRLDEGGRHQGLAEVVRFAARKP